VSVISFRGFICRWEDQCNWSGIEWCVERDH
jgi:hypothetical protein